MWLWLWLWWSWSRPKSSSIPWAAGTRNGNPPLVDGAEASDVPYIGTAQLAMPPDAPDSHPPFAASCETEPDRGGAQSPARQRQAPGGARRLQAVSIAAVAWSMVVEKERKGKEKERRGKERKRKGEERKGKEKGKERRGKERRGKERKGKERKGKEGEERKERKGQERARTFSPIIRKEEPGRPNTHLVAKPDVCWPSARL